MFLDGTVLVYPRPDGNEARLDLDKVLTAEARQQEVAFVNRGKAPELLRDFNVAWRDLHDIMLAVTRDALTADKAAELRKATLTVDSIPAILAEKKLTSNEANREALILLDEEYQRLRDIADQVHAVVMWLKGKLKGFENAFSSVKALVREDSFLSIGQQNHNLKGGAPIVGPTQAKPSEWKAAPARTPKPGESFDAPPPAFTVTKKNGFGKPRY